MKNSQRMTGAPTNPASHLKLLEQTRIADVLRQFASARNCTPAQLALAWLLNQGDDVIPIPGTTKVARLEENVESINIQLTSDELREIASALPAAEGGRYKPEFMRLLDA
jgi:aryl-alcohol dehydrogenase-like predicted oxidoreductase